MKMVGYFMKGLKLGTHFVPMISLSRTFLVFMQPAEKRFKQTYFAIQKSSFYTNHKNKPAQKSTEN